MGQMLLYKNNDNKKLKPELKKIFKCLAEKGFLKSYFSKNEISELLNSSGSYIGKYNS